MLLQWALTFGPAPACSLIVHPHKLHSRLPHHAVLESCGESILDFKHGASSLVLAQG